MSSNFTDVTDRQHKHRDLWVALTAALVCTGAGVAVAIWAAELSQAHVRFWPRAGEVTGLALTTLGILLALAIVWGWWLPGGFRDGPSVSSPEPKPSQPPIEDSPAQQAPPSVSRLSMEEVIELGKKCGKTSKAIYAFLNSQATRSDEPKVVAEYRQKFDARVSNVGLDLIAGGLSDTERLKNVLRPAASVDDIQWIARGLASYDESYSGEQLARYRAKGTELLSAQGDPGQKTNTIAPPACPEPIRPPARRASQADVPVNTGGDETARSEPRVTCPLSPKELIRLYFLGSTDVQGKKLIAQYKEQWREVSATVEQMEMTVSGSSLYVSCKDSDQMAVAFLFEPDAWGARLAALMPGDQIEATGQICLVNRIMVTFDCCELVDP